MSTEDFKQMVTPCDDPYPNTPTPAPVPTPDEVETPRTNAEAYEATPCHYDGHTVVNSSFARTLERDLLSAQAALAEAAKDKERLEHVINGGAVLTWDGPRKIVSRMHYPVTRAQIDAARAEREGGVK